MHDLVSLISRIRPELASVEQAVKAIDRIHHRWSLYGLGSSVPQEDISLVQESLESLGVIICIAREYKDQESATRLLHLGLSAHRRANLFLECLLAEGNKEANDDLS
jgi:hypothetical protein